MFEILCLKSFIKFVSRMSCEEQAGCTSPLEVKAASMVSYAGAGGGGDLMRFLGCILRGNLESSFSDELEVAFEEETECRSVLEVDAASCRM